MANKYRGEIDACLDGKTHRLCLTLGALAELEAAFGDEDMLALAARFEGGRLRAEDAVRIIGAGLRGAGAEIADEAVACMRCENGAAGFVTIVAELLAVTFGGGPADDVAAASDRDAVVDAPEGTPVPFPGATSPGSASSSWD